MSKSKRRISMVWEEDGTVDVKVQWGYDDQGMRMSEIQKEGIWILLKQILSSQQHRTDDELRGILKQQQDFLIQL